MKVRKNLEAVFLSAAVMATFAAYATADEPVVRSARPVAAVVATAAINAPAIDPSVQVVEVKAKRLNAAEKAALN